MAPDQSYGATLSTRVPSNRVTALEALAFERSSRHNNIDRSKLVRDAVDCYLYENWDEIPADERSSLNKSELEQSRKRVMEESA